CFSSRRRHTRSKRDWSSDVCSSDLTGTSPRLFFWDREEEEPIVRSLQGANISEQKMMVSKVARRSVNAFVTECMAVNPEYQHIRSEERRVGKEFRNSRRR